MPDTHSRLALIAVLIVSVALIALVALVIIVGRDPVVEEISPDQVSPGEEVVLTGRNFGSSVESLTFAGRELPTSSILSWSENEIRFVVPREADSGLLYVVTHRGRSRGRLVQIRESVPRTSFVGEGPGAPRITNTSSSEVTVGSLLTLEGENFGRSRRNSRVAFPTEDGGACAPCASEVTYAAWSDGAITVRVPSGARSGFLSVVTPWGGSNPIRIVVERPAGVLVHEQPLEIALRYGAAIDRVALSGDGESDALPGEQDIVLRLPTVAEAPAQRGVRYLDDEPSLFRFERVAADFRREVVRTLIVERYAVRSEINPAAISAAYEAETGFFEYYTRPLPPVPATDPGVVEIAASLRRGRASPFRIAEAAYVTTLDALVYALGLQDRSALAGLESGYGDDFTYAMLFTALTRAARVPARPVGGVLVTADEQVYPHFWAEFFVSGIGWIPVDPALGDGAFPAGFPVPESPRRFYFGNLDSHRVAFHHGFDEAAVTYLDGVRVAPEDPYTLQRSYAEGGLRIDSFRLSWYNPRVIGRLASPLPWPDTESADGPSFALLGAPGLTHPGSHVGRAQRAPDAARSDSN